MKRCGNLWETLISWENLVLAARKSRRGKRGKGCIQRFEFDLEAELLQLQDELVRGDYVPGDFKTHWITRPKPRMISAAPYRDRVVHHALMNILEPILDRHFHPDCYACRKEKGTHAAVNRLQRLMQRNGYALQCDIQRFFPSIDHSVMKTLFRQRIKDKKVLALMDLIVDCSNEQPSDMQWFEGDDLFTPAEHRKGLPIGNLTSQWFANWYLSGLDHFITSRLGVGAYVRYCDDFIVLADDRATLVGVREAIRDYLSQLRLKLHTHKNFIRPVKSGLTFVGMRIWPHHRLLRKANIKSFRKRMKWMRNAYACGLIDTDYIKPRLASWIGHSGQTDSKILLCRLCKEWRFQRATPDKLSRYPRRQLEQQRQQLHGLEPEQQQPGQHEQQQRIPGVSLSLLFPAFSRISRKGHVYGYGSRGVENPRRCPEPAKRLLCGQMCVTLPGGFSRPWAEPPVRTARKIA